MPNKAPVIIDRADMYAISPAEAVAKAREDTARMAADKRIPDQNLLEKKEMAKGYYLDWNELVRRIGNLNSKILFQPGGISNAIAVRYPKPDGMGGFELEYVTGFYCKPLPEFSSVETDDKGLPTREIRGWRSVLTALIRCGALTKKQCDVTFGPALGERSSLWYRNLRENS